MDRVDDSRRIARQHDVGDAARSIWKNVGEYSPWNRGVGAGKACLGEGAGARWKPASASAAVTSGGRWIYLGADGDGRGGADQSSGFFEHDASELSRKTVPSGVCIARGRDLGFDARASGEVRQQESDGRAPGFS